MDPGHQDGSADGPCAGPGAGAAPDMLARIGGKAANLGDLMRAGLPGPAGFCLTTRGVPAGRLAPRNSTAVHARPRGDRDQ